MARGLDAARTGLSRGTYLHYEERNRTFEGIGTYVEEVYTLSEPTMSDQTPESIRIAYVSPVFFSILGATPAAGRLPTAADFQFGDPEAVLLWVRRYGGDPRIVGRTIELDGRAAVVTGVAQASLDFPHPEMGAWIVWAYDRVESRMGAAAQIEYLTLSGIGRLEAGVSVEAAQRDIDGLVASLPDAYGDVTSEDLEALGLRASITPLKEAIVGDARPALLMLLGAATFLLLIMWANVTNLSLLRAEHRRREVGVARALGGSTGRIVRGFVLENVFLAALGEFWVWSSRTWRRAFGSDSMRTRSRGRMTSASMRGSSSSPWRCRLPARQSSAPPRPSARSGRGSPGSSPVSWAGSHRVGGRS